MAKAQGVVIIGGSTPFPAADGLVTNSCLMFDRTGRRLCRYDKIHLFDVEVSEEEAYRESSYIASGEDLVTATVEEMMFGLTICYDMRFPELYRALSQRGAEIFSIPSAFTVPTWTGTLAYAFARPRNRKPGLGYRAGADRAPPARSGNLWTQPDRGALGRADRRVF
jgi:predicted amidohydrolase